MKVEEKEVKLRMILQDYHRRNNYELQQAVNDILALDALPPAQKCGLLPSELLRQRDELREALENACNFIKCTPLLKHDEDRPRGLERWESLIEAAIKNTEG